MIKVDLTESKDEAVHRSGGRAQGSDVSSERLPSEAESRFVDHETILSLHKAASGKVRRRWEFVWNGFRISGPVLDEDFLQKLEKGTMSIKEGREFKATLRVHQVREKMSGSWLNERYEIMKLDRLIAQSPNAQKSHVQNFANNNKEENSLL